VADANILSLSHDDDRNTFEVYCWDVDFMQDLFCFIDNILSLSNLMFVDYVDRIYPIELEIIKDITDTDRSDSYIDLHIQIDSNGQLNKH
jgi:hypothetical protein